MKRITIIFFVIVIASVFDSCGVSMRKYLKIQHANRELVKKNDTLNKINNKLNLEKKYLEKKVLKLEDQVEELSKLYKEQLDKKKYLLVEQENNKFKSLNFLKKNLYELKEHKSNYILKNNAIASSIKKGYKDLEANILIEILEDEIKYYENLIFDDEISMKENCVIKNYLLNVKASDEIVINQYFKEGTTFVDCKETMLSKLAQMGYKKPKFFIYKDGFGIMSEIQKLGTNETAFDEKDNNYARSSLREVPRKYTNRNTYTTRYVIMLLLKEETRKSNEYSRKEIDDYYRDCLYYNCNSEEIQKIINSKNTYNDNYTFITKIIEFEEIPKINESNPKEKSDSESLIRNILTKN